MKKIRISLNKKEIEILMDWYVIVSEHIMVETQDDKIYSKLSKYLDKLEERNNGKDNEKTNIYN